MVSQPSSGEMIRAGSTQLEGMHLGLGVGFSWNILEGNKAWDGHGLFVDLSSFLGLLRGFGPTVEGRPLGGCGLSQGG